MRNLVFIPCLALLPIIAGCLSGNGAGDEPDEATGAESALVADTTVPLTAEDMAGAEITDSKIVFRTLTENVKRIRPDFVITAKVSDSEAFIRKVTTVILPGDGTRVVETIDASVTEAARSAKAQKHISLDPVGYDQSGKVLAAGDGLTLSCESCFLKATPSLDVGFDLRPSEPARVSLAFDGKLAGDLSLALETADAGGAVSKEVELLSLKKTFVQTVGPIPIWETVGVTFVAGIRASLTATAALRAGVSFEKDLHISVSRDATGWHADEGTDGSVSLHEPVFEQVVGGTASVYVKARIEASVYSIASAFLEASARADVDAKLCPSPATWKAKGTLALDAGARLYLPFVDDPSYERRLFSASDSRDGAIPGATLAKACLGSDSGGSD